MNDLLVAEIVTTHGIKGEVKAVYFTDSPDFFDGINELYLSGGERPDGGKTGGASTVPNKLIIENARFQKGAVYFKFKGFDGIDEGARLAGEKLFLPRELAPELPEGRHFIVDLLGCDVILPSGEALGRVARVFNTGGSDVYEVLSAKNNDKKYYIPVIDEVVREISTEKKRIMITPIEGLLDEN